MAQSDLIRLAESTLGHAVAEFGGAAELRQTGAIVLALLVAWVMTRLGTQRFPASGSPAYWSADRLGRIAFPLLAALLLIAMRKSVLDVPAPLATVALEVLASLALVRLAVYTLNYVFSPGPAVLALQKIVVWTVWAAVALDLADLLEPFVALLEQTAISVGKQRVSVLVILEAGAVAVSTLLLALWAGRVAETRLLALEGLDLNIRVVLAKLARALLVVLAALIVLPAFGIDLTVLSVIGGALGVGLGFGLQKIASNYVSGFIILVDRAIRLGDLVTVDNRTGTVTRLNARYTVLRGLDGVESIIPNETFVVNTVLRHADNRRRAKVELRVTVTRDSPIERALAVMEEQCRLQPRIVDDPAPAALVAGLGDSGVDLELVYHVDNPEAGHAPVRSAVLLAIRNAFEQHGIAIAAPQRHIRLLGEVAQSSPAG